MKFSLPQQLQWHKLVGIFFIIFVAILYQASNLLIFAKNDSIKEYQLNLRPVVQIPVLREKVGLSSQKSEFAIKDLTAKAIYVEDVGTGTKLFEKNAERLLLPASTTKIMTALVVRDQFKLDTVLTVPDVDDIAGSSVEFFAGENLTVENLLKATLIQSSNRAAYTLASGYTGGVTAFVELMNTKAKMLHLKSSWFNNPVGFDASRQRSSAHDLAILSKELMKDEFLRSVVGTSKLVITDVTNQHHHQLHTTNHLLDLDETVVGIKTGTTAGANQVLITQFNRGDKQILVVIMGSEDRYTETSEIIDWVFANYIWLTPKQIFAKS